MQARDGPQIELAQKRILERCALKCNAIQVRCLIDLRSVGTDGLGRVIVRKDEQDVRAFRTNVVGRNVNRQERDREDQYARR